MTKTAEFTNSINPDEETHYELPHLDPHCLSSSFESSIWYSLVKHNYQNFADVNFVVCLLAFKELRLNYIGFGVDAFGINISMPFFFQNKSQWMNFHQPCVQ